MKHKHLIKAVAFTLIFLLLFSYATQVLTVSSEDREYQWISGIYEEPENSLDAVYIGSSNCYAFWNANVAWNNYGIAVHPFTCSSLSLLAAEYCVKEMRKRQPDAVYVVNINTFREKALTSVALHRLLDFMPFSLNKLQLTNHLCDIKGVSYSDRLEYFLPIIRYHDKWSEIDQTNFSTELNGLKGGDLRRWSLEDKQDFSDKYIKSDSYADISNNLTKSLNSLLDYCDEENVKIVFVTVPQIADSEEYVGQLNTINKIVSDRGYPTVNLFSNYEDINIDLATDYYNEEHTNVHGALKFTEYICEYLIENYNFEDKRENADYASWNESYQEYYKTASRYALDFELDFSSQRDFDLEKPKSFKAEENDGNVNLSWKEVENADGYAIYKKVDKNSWELLKFTDDTTYTDKKVEKEKKYSYAVVPYRLEKNEKLYGKYKYNGIEVQIP